MLANGESIRFVYSNGSRAQLARAIGYKKCGRHSNRQKIKTADCELQRMERPDPAAWSFITTPRDEAYETTIK
jgi:hypothetical protein